MAKLFINDKEYELEDGASISEACENAGVPFNCNSGVCGSCQIKIIEGENNLNEITEEEIDLGLDKKNRLSCLCIIKKGVVKITF